jgi:predicted anti-sigma-YlaC factor YlaD
MPIGHLNDEDIQIFLDGKSPEKHKEIEGHLRNCQICRTAVQKYRLIYTVLEDDFEVELSPDFSRAVMSRLQSEERNRLFMHISFNIALSLGAFIIFMLTVYITNFTTVMGEIARSIIFYFSDSTITVSVKQAISNLNGDLILLFNAGIALLVIALLDHWFTKRRRRMI